MIAANDSHDAAQIHRFNAFPHKDFNTPELALNRRRNQSGCPWASLAGPEPVISRLNVQARENCGFHAS
jgi:hypothetical protein